MDSIIYGLQGAVYTVYLFSIFRGNAICTAVNPKQKSMHESSEHI